MNDFKGIEVEHITFGKEEVVKVDRYNIFIQFANQHPMLPPHKIPITDFFAPNATVITNPFVLIEYITNQIDLCKCLICESIDLIALQSGSRLSPVFLSAYSVQSSAMLRQFRESSDNPVLSAFGRQLNNQLQNARFQKLLRSEIHHCRINRSNQQGKHRTLQNTVPN